MSQEMIVKKMQLGDLVWARMQRCAPWPAIIIPPRKKPRTSYVYCLYFESKDHSFVSVKNVCDYQKGYEEFSKTANPQLLAAIKAANRYEELLKEYPDYVNQDEAEKDIIRQKLLCQASDEINEVKPQKKTGMGKRSAKKNSAQRSEASAAKLKTSASVKKLSRERRNALKLQIISKTGMRKYSADKNAAQPRKAVEKPEKPASVKKLTGEPKRTSKPPNINKTGMDKGNSTKGISTQPRKSSGKPKASVSAKKLAREPKRISKRLILSKTEMGKRSAKEDSTKPRKISAKTKMSVAAKESVRGPRRGSKQQFIIKKSKIRYMPSAGRVRGRATTPRGLGIYPDQSTSSAYRMVYLSDASTSVVPPVFYPGTDNLTVAPIIYPEPNNLAVAPIIYPGPGTSSAAPIIYPDPCTSSAIPEIANGRIVYCDESQEGTLVRSSKQHIPYTLGFVGIGELAHALVSHLLGIGVRIYIWNRTPGKCDDLIKLGAIHTKMPSDVAEKCDIVFCTVIGTRAITEVCLGGLCVTADGGIVPGFKRSKRKDKGFVMMSSIKPETSMILSEDFRRQGVEYLEAQVTLNSPLDQDCHIRVLCAGSRSLFEKLPPCFAATEAQFIFISPMLGEGPRMKFAYIISNVCKAVNFVDAVKVLRQSGKPEECLSFIMNELDNICPDIKNKFKEMIFFKEDENAEISVLENIRKLRATLKALYEWYPKKPTHISTADMEALEAASGKGAGTGYRSAVYDLTVWNNRKKLQWH